MDTLKLVLIGTLTTTGLAVVHPCIAQTAPVTAAALPPVPAAPPAVAVKTLAPPAAPAPAARPAPPASPAPPKVALGARHHVIIDGKMIDGGQARTMTPEEKADLDRQLAQIGPTVRKALADAHIAELVAKQTSAANAQTQAEVARQMAELGPRIQKAIADAHISEVVARKLAEAQPRIDAAIAKGQAAAEKGREAADRARIETEKLRPSDPN